jgi:hypothetical protein
VIVVFDPKKIKFSAVNFYQFSIILKPWIRIRNGIQPKMLDRYPDLYQNEYGSETFLETAVRSP